MEKLDSYLTINQAAKFLSVSPNTRRATSVKRKAK